MCDLSLFLKCLEEKIQTINDIDRDFSENNKENNLSQASTK